MLQIGSSIYRYELNAGKEKRGGRSYCEMDGPLTVCSCHGELSGISSGEAIEA